MKSIKKFTKLLFCFLVSLFFVCIMAVFQDTVTSLLWLSNNGFDITYIIFFQSITHDIIGSSLLYVILLITLFLAFIITSLLRLLIPLNGYISYSLAGFVSLYVMIQITLIVFDKLYVIASVRNDMGLLIFCLIGMFGGLIFYSLINILCIKENLNDQVN